MRVVVCLEAAVANEVIGWFRDDGERSGFNDGRTVDRAHFVDVLLPEIEI